MKAPNKIATIVEINKKQGQQTLEKMFKNQKIINPDPTYCNLLSMRKISGYLKRSNRSVLKIPRTYITEEFQNIYKSTNM